MYLDHFGLSEAPFRITPHTDFFFSGANRGATLEALMYAITRDEGIVRVTGEVGSGKTMLCRVLMERLPAQVQTAYIANPTLSREDILHALADELHLSLSAERPNALLKALQEHLIGKHAEGRQVVVLIDEAHAMPAETLEEIRLLSNLETKRNKLLQIVLFGQSELDQVLDRPQMRQLKDRITHRFSLEPLNRADVSAYLDFRMRAAGYRGPSVFASGAARLIARASAGLTRRINILADKSLLATFASGTHLVTEKEVKAAVRDAAMTMPVNGTRRLLAIAALGVVAAAAALAIWAGNVPDTVTPPAPDAPKPIGHTTAGPPSAVSRELNPEPATPAPSNGEADSGSGGGKPAGTASTGGETGATATVPTVPTQAETPTVSMPAAAKPPASAAGTDSETLLRRTDAWLAQVPDEHWFLQLLSAQSVRLGEIERFIARSASEIDVDQLRAYRATVGDNVRIGIIYGDYPTLAAASAALAELPPALRAHGAFPRQVRRLKP